MKQPRNLLNFNSGRDRFKKDPFKAMRKSFTKSNGNFAGIHYTTEHTAKMAGVVSLSTDINSNPICQGRRKIAGSVCSKCFSADLWDDKKGQYRKVNQAFKNNTEILCGRLLKDEEIPQIDWLKFPVFRFEAFADLQNTTQVFNYFKICRKNPRIRFALWTKNPGFIAAALRIVPKPENLQIILSSMNLNKPAAGVRFPFVDKVFTVYDDATIEAENIDINCGARSCMGCQLCYKPNANGAALVQVRERLK